MEVLAVRRSREDIERDKKAKDERRQARKKKGVDEHAAIMQVAEFENIMAVDDREQETKFPRHRQALAEMFQGKRKKGQTGVTAKSNKNSLAAECDDGCNADTDVSDSEEHGLKKQKTSASDSESTGWHQRRIK